MREGVCDCFCLFLFPFFNPSKSRSFGYGEELCEYPPQKKEKRSDLLTSFQFRVQFAFTYQSARMCIRKVLYCPICKTYESIPEITIPTPPGAIVFTQEELPCGLSYCHHFNPYFLLRDPPLDLRELEIPCNPRCKVLACKLMPVIRECCGPNASPTYFRRHSLRLAQLEYSGSQRPIQRPVRPPTRRALQPIARSDPSPSSVGPQPAPSPSRPFSEEQVFNWVCEACSWADYRRLRRGEVITITVSQCRLTLSGGDRGFVGVSLLSLDPENSGSQEFQLSLGCLISGFYWGF